MGRQPDRVRVIRERDSGVAEWGTAPRGWRENCRAGLPTHYGRHLRRKGQGQGREVHGSHLLRPSGMVGMGGRSSAGWIPGTARWFPLRPRGILLGFAPSQFWVRSGSNEVGGPPTPPTPEESMEAHHPGRHLADTVRGSGGVIQFGEVVGGVGSHPAWISLGKRSQDRLEARMG